MTAGPEARPAPDTAPAAGTQGDGAWPDRSAEMAAMVGQPAGPPSLSPHAVNEPMIRHWVEAMGDFDPVYVDAAAARAAGLPGVIAPPTMLQAWTMRGLRATLEIELARAEGRVAGDSAMDRVMSYLDEEGMTSVVATNSDQTYHRPLFLGDRVVVTSVIESISDVKKTALGVGRFFTSRLDYLAVPDSSLAPDDTPESLAARGEPVATMRFRILKFRPGTGAAAKTGGAAKARGGQPEPEAAPRPRRPRPALTQDNAFWFEGARQRKLLIQRCTNCGRLRHTPLPACAACQSFDWDTVESTGRGEVYSFVVVHHPQVPAFDYPLPIGLIELEEGTRVVADLVGLDPSAWKVGMAVAVDFVDFDDDLTLPVFRPAPTGQGSTAGVGQGPHASEEVGVGAPTGQGSTA
ncbi:MAG TPA: OB-fold domain-containing protein [Acidimicrobiales bacterium]|nr:OB-fold domain-containing protein [Acidimicrobiales bacterium]